MLATALVPVWSWGQQWAGAATEKLNPCKAAAEVWGGEAAEGRPDTGALLLRGRWLCKQQQQTPVTQRSAHIVIMSSCSHIKLH